MTASDRAGVAAVFEREWTRLVAILVRDFRDLATAEDAVQEAFIEASQRWDRDGTPDRPAAWLLTTARRRAIDRTRRAGRLDALLPLIDRDDAERAAQRAPHDVEAALDEQLALLVGCCHPALSREAQVALTLRIVGGLSTSQIARAFLATESTMTRRISRAKEKVRLAGIPFDAPTVETLAERLPAVCAVIHSIFTEGHTSSDARELIRGDLCDEAIWLGELLHRLLPAESEVDGLLALMLLIDARRATRVDDAGMPVLLADQDRSKWDRRRIDRGLAALARAAPGRGDVDGGAGDRGADDGGVFLNHAKIAALHATAPSFAATDWAEIVNLYNDLLVQAPTALLALNRAIAVAEAHGPATALYAINSISRADDLDGDLSAYPYFHAARGEMLARLGQRDAAISALGEALALSENRAQRLHLERRRDEIAAQPVIAQPVIAQPDMDGAGRLPTCGSSEPTVNEHTVATQITRADD